MKVNPDWLRPEPMRTWLADRTDLAVIGPWLGEEGVVALASYGAIAPSPGHAVTPPARRPLVVTALAAWFVVQVLVPLRHVLYPGNVSWTEEGHNFSWQMLPDMLLRFAHHLAALWERERGIEGAEVRAVVRCSLNGRPPALLIDPDRDLARVRRSLAPADWIGPLD